MEQNRPNLADVYIGRHMPPPEQLLVNDTRFKFDTEIAIRSYVETYYFMLDVQGDRYSANQFTLSGSTMIRRMLEMMVECTLIPADDATMICSICKYIGTDLNINERVKDEWI